MSGFNQTGCSKQEIFLTEVTFICVLKSDDLPYHGIYYSFSKIFINFHYILYIYIIYIYNIDDPTYVRSLGVAIWSYLHPSISTALMRPRRPKQYCLQLVIHIYIYIYIYIYIGSSNVSFGFLPFSRQLPSKTGVHIPFSFRVSVHQRTKPYKVEATLSVICSLSQQSTRAFIGLRRLPDLIGTSPSLVIFLRTCLDCQVKLCTGLDLNSTYFYLHFQEQRDC